MGDGGCRGWYEGDPILEEYHDHEWCRENHDDRFRFEMLCLEGASVGLSWKTILNKREAYRRVFNLPLSLRGSDFQIRVWSALRDIPYGETRSYQEIAAAVGNSKAARAVGMANNRNPVLILIPCHRVVGKSGKLVGYAGGIERKQHLLEMEAMRNGKPCDVSRRGDTNRRGR